MHSEREILVAVLTRWLEPMSSSLLSGKVIETFPAIESLSNKIRSMGWVSPGWTLAREIEPLIGNASGAMMKPVIEGLLDKLPEEGIAEMAHGIVDGALTRGQLSLMEGRVTFDRDDLARLKRLMDANLPVERHECYEVIEA